MVAVMPIITKLAEGLCATFSLRTTPMDYLGYWGLKRRPFDQDDAEFFYTAGAQREAIAGLGYFLAGTWNSAFLVAPAKSGTTWLLRRLTGMSGFGDCAAEVFLTSGSDPNLSVAAQLAIAIGLRSETANLPDELDAISAAIAATSNRGIRTVWLIDDCHATAANLAKNLVMADGDLSVVMVAKPENMNSLASAFGRCCMQLEIEPLELSDSFEFVAEGLRHAGSDRPLFVDTSIVRMHEIAEGRIASLAMVAESSLRLAARYRKEEITPAIVEAIADQRQQAA